MQKKLAAKLGIVIGLSLLLLIPLLMIEGQIRSRSRLQEDVVHDIATSSADSQVLVGPILVLQYTERVMKVYKDRRNDTEQTRFENVAHQLVMPLDSLGIEAKGSVETRHRGIYSASLYHIDTKLSGNVEIPASLGEKSRSGQIVGQIEVSLVMGVSDLRGITNDPALVVNGKTYHFSTDYTPTESLKIAGKKLSVVLEPFDPGQNQTFHIEFPLKLSGTEFFGISPTAKETRLTMQSDWQHPSFQGRFLPQERNIGADGFSARWQVSHLARNFEHALQGYDAMTVSFIEPVNVYLKAERAVKYGIIFIVLTFSAFFMQEITRRNPIHPLQYLMVGLAQAIFFLLLIALSEHIPFLYAYLVAAVGCICLIGSYLAGIFRSARQGALFGGGLVLLYGILYGVLLSEGSALLLGALLLFAALGAIMMLTRHVDWYRIGETNGKTVQSSSL